jgi:hypothetical protein
MKKPTTFSDNQPAPTGVALQRLVRPPAWLLEQEQLTVRQWKVRKRRELNDVIKVMSTYSLGCAYCPGKSGEVGKIDDALKSLKQNHSAKVWGR